MSIITKKLSLISAIILAVFVALYAWNAMQRFKVQLVESSPDNPVFYTNALRNPFSLVDSTIFDTPADQVVPLKIITSAIDWIPFLLWYFAGVSPYASTWALALLQGVLIAPAIYFLARSGGRSALVAVFCAVFAYAATPWDWAGANYGATTEWNFLPYAGILIIPFVLCAFAFLVRGRVIPVLLLLTAGGLIHPSLSLYASAAVGFYWLFEGVRTHSWGILLRRLVGLAVVVTAFMLPTLKTLSAMSGDSLPVAEVLLGMSKNLHIGAWLSSWSLELALGWALLSLLAWRWRAGFSGAYGRLWLAAWASAIVFSLSQYLGGILGIPLLLTLIGLRSISWASLVALPLVVNYWIEHIKSGNWLGVFLSLLCLCLPLYEGYNAIQYLLIFCLLLVDVSQGSLFIWTFKMPKKLSYGLQAIAAFVLFAWATVFVFYPIKKTTLPIPYTIFKPFVNMVNSLVSDNIIRIDIWPGNKRVLLFFGVFLVCLVYWLVKKFNDKKAASSVEKRTSSTLFPVIMTGLFVLYAASFLLVNWQPPLDERADPMISAQLWIRDHLPADARLFIYDTHWETLTERWTMPAPVRVDYSYIPTRQVPEYRDRLLRLYGLTFDKVKQDGLTWTDLFIMIQARMAKFNADDYRKFNKEFGITHVVLKKIKGQILDLPVVYQNDQYIIYRLVDGT